MKIFLDTANVEHIREGAALGVVDGVTTNPSLIAKEGKDITATIKEICSIVKGPVSAEVIALDHPTMVQEALKLREIADNVVVKIPFTKDGIIATNMLSKMNIPVNVTLIFSPNQALLACKAGARYISPFAGRLDDIGHDGVSIAAECQDIVENYGFETEVIAASIRHTLHVSQCAANGIDIATIPLKVLYDMFKHPLTDIGIQQFLADWKKSQE